MLPDPEDGVAMVAAGFAAPVDVAGFPESDLDVGGHAAQGPVGTDYLADSGVVPAVLYGNEEAFGFYVPLDEMGGPLGVVGLDADDSDVEQVVDILGVGQVHGVDRHREIALATAGPQALGPHGFHMLRPHVDEGNVLTLFDEVGSHVATYRASSNDAYLVTHFNTPARRRLGAASGF